MKGVVAFLLVLCGITEVQAQTTFTYDNLAVNSGPIVVYGSADVGDGKRNTFLLEQPNADNPLGNPIQVSAPPENASVELQQVSSATLPKSISQQKVVSESLPVNPQLSATETPQKVNEQIQDTLYESGGRIYDIQSYPVKDIDYVETPNINPTITTYPPI